MRRIVLTTEAKADIAEATAWYRDRSVQAAKRFLLAVGAAFARIEAQPTAQMIVDPHTGTRRSLLWRFPHRVLYLIDGEKIVVFAIMHHRRDDPAWRTRLEG